MEIEKNKPYFTPKLNIYVKVKQRPYRAGVIYKTTNHEINCFVGFNLRLRTNQMHHFLKNDAFDFTMTVKRALSEIFCMKRSLFRKV